MPVGLAKTMESPMGIWRMRLIDYVFEMFSYVVAYREIDKQTKNKFPLADVMITLFKNRRVFDGLITFYLCYMRIILLWWCYNAANVLQNEFIDTSLRAGI